MAGVCQLLIYDVNRYVLDNVYCILQLGAKCVAYYDTWDMYIQIIVLYKVIKI